jgi:hypothetical protein
MTSDQFIQGLIAFAVANATVMFAIGRWGVTRAIKYTHLERDVVELQNVKKAQDETNAKVQNDLKGLSIKIDKGELKDINSKIDKLILLKSQ